MNRQLKKKAAPHIKLQKQVKSIRGLKPKSNLVRLRKIKDEEIELDAKKNHDVAPVLCDWPDNVGVYLPKRKVQISLRIDPDVLDYFKHQGKGHLTKMNAVLKAYASSRRARHAN
jgi:uncharacterized protein (DUF4415 family)